MPARIRSIKPEWLDDEKMSMATAEARVLSIALILMADDYGNGRCNELVLAGRVFPSHSRDPRETIASLQRAIRDLVNMRFIALYESDGQHYYTIRKWREHQKVDRPSKPLVPAPPQNIWTPVTTEKIETLARPSRALTETLARPSRDPRATLDLDQDQDQEMDQDQDRDPARTGTLAHATLRAHSESAAAASVETGQTNRGLESKPEPPCQSQPKPRHPMPSGTNGLVPRTAEQPSVATHDAPVVRSARSEATSTDSDVQSKTPCPSDLKLAPAQRATLETSMIPGWAIDVLTQAFVSSAVADPSDTRPLVAWRKCLAKAICSNWNNPLRRPKKPEQEVQAPRPKHWTLAELEAREIQRGNTLPPRKKVIVPRSGPEGGEKLSFEQQCERAGIDPKTVQNPFVSINIGGEEINMVGAKL